MDIFNIPSSGGGQLHCRKWLPEERPKVVETTAFGAAALAGLYAGVWKDFSEIAAERKSERVFTP